MKLKLACTSCILLTMGLFCFANAGEHASERDAFEAAAKQFRLASETNRYHEAEKVVDTLPKYPKTYETNTGIGLIEGFDRSKPSYLLPVKDVQKLLGEPSTVTTNSIGIMFIYKASTPPGDFNWTLHIQFEKDQVLTAGFFGQEKKH